MRLTTGVVFATLALVVLAPGASAQSQAPEGILASLEGAYHSKDVAAYAALLAPEYEFVSKEGTSWDAERDCAGHEGLFENSKTLHLEFERSFQMEALTSAGTWAIRHIPMTLAVTDNNGKKFTVNSTATLYLRWSPESRAVQVYRWVDEVGAAGS